ncbi:MAG: ABC transporter substrate-binding protein, partial [Actinomycetota bacterium]
RYPPAPTGRRRWIVEAHFDSMPRTSTTTTLAVAALLFTASCGSDATDDGTSADASSAAGLAVSADAPFPAERCAANEMAGTITYLTGFDFAAASSIIDVIVADANGYFDELCLDVEIRPSFSSANYGLIATGTAQFASGGSFSEAVAFAAANDGDVVVLSVEGRSPIDTLIVKAGEALELDDLAGTTIGVKGKLPTSIDVMLRSAGLVEGDDFDTVLLDGFDPLAHLEIDSIVGLPGWKSNEVGAVERAGVAVQLFDPETRGVPGSFGVIVSDPDFVEQHPTAAEDFMRATMRGLAEAINDPARAAEIAVETLEASGNPNFLSPEGEAFRWQTEAQLILSATPEGVGLATPDLAGLQRELDTYAEVGLFGDGVRPSAEDHLDGDLVANLYADGVLIWPTTP